MASFAEGFKTDIVMEEITKDAARSLAQSRSPSGGLVVLKRTVERQSFWKRIDSA